MIRTPMILERLGALVHQAVRDDAARHGLLPIHLQVLQYLAQANRYSDLPIAIAEYFGITRGTVSQTLSVLERRGLLTKARDPAHGRRVHLRLTPQGLAILGGSWTERVQAALCAEPASAQLDETLVDVLAALQRINGRRAFGVCSQCAHFRADAGGTHCGLTGEPLAAEQTGKICREWTAPIPTD
ncbi:MAG: MarR family transcriptional regulator [Lautropia sp. SCN 70-15]|nr:MAG: MarR family transcriptional regulator [Lautropia sp. SCN 70-15]